MVEKNTMTINIIYVCTSEGQLINNLGSQEKQFPKPFEDLRFFFQFSACQIYMFDVFYKYVYKYPNFPLSIP